MPYRNCLGRMRGKVSLAPINIMRIPEMLYESRVDILISTKIALWDVLASCTRESSLDADIVAASITANDF